ncbi:MAG: tRNA pseudouridine(55) synthase TruB [Spirochaetaceae bacterium]|jgi:tRNA pseudouridine55 synthase|nr:tRNA pseudouridine(55) synthase TruB [Spirochaetaceae bacterium]
MNYLLYDKPEGVTSFEALYPIKRALGSGKVGHTGTLDKFASGLLVVLEGRALKLARFFSGCSKRYIAAVRFGQETETLDPEGRVIAQAPPPTPAALEAALPAFRGQIMQTPPLYSAVHIDGKRAHKLARKRAASGGAPDGTDCAFAATGADGADLEARITARPVTIHSLDLLSYSPEPQTDFYSAVISVHCTSGTYIRSLARDIARACGSRASLSALRRLSVGGFSVDAAYSGTPPFPFRRVDADCFAKLGINVQNIDAGVRAAFRYGRPLSAIDGISLPKDARTIAFFCEDTLAAVIEKEKGNWKYAFVNAGE